MFQYLIRGGVRRLLYLPRGEAMFSYHPGVRTFLSVLLSRGALSHKNHVNLMLGHSGKYDKLSRSAKKFRVTRGCFSFFNKT